jgi:hypothetical protein
MLSILVPNIHSLENGRNFGQRKEKLRVNGSEEVLAALGGRVVETEVVVKVGDPSVERVNLEVINSV